METIYFDNNATTRVDPAALEAMLPFLGEEYGNPSSGYGLGKRAAAALAGARERVAGLLHCEPEEVVFTASGTEANNAAIESALRLDPDRQHIVTTRVEHSAVLKACERAARRGVEVTWLDVDGAGRLDLGQLESAIRPETALVSVMWGNNETGGLFPIEAIGEICRQKKTLFHTDAVQAVGKVPVRLGSAHVSFLSLAGHKLHAPKGVGALYVARRTKFVPLVVGGDQERGRRAGTENVASIVALGKACELAADYLGHENSVVRELRDRLEAGILEKIPGVAVNGDPSERTPNTTNLAFEGVESEGALILLDRAGIACSAGSACHAGSAEPSHVLRAMGHSDARARSSLRFSLGRFNTGAEVDRVLEVLPGVIGRLRENPSAAAR